MASVERDAGLEQAAGLLLFAAWSTCDHRTPDNNPCLDCVVRACADMSIKLKQALRLEKPA